MSETVELSIKCRRCEKHHKLRIPRENYNRWIDGEVIQSALPMLTANQRELLISKTCGVCFDKMFGKE